MLRLLAVTQVTWLRDSLRTSSLYLPAALIFTVLYLGIVSRTMSMFGALRCGQFGRRCVVHPFSPPRSELGTKKYMYNAMLCLTLARNASVVM